MRAGDTIERQSFLLLLASCLIIRVSARIVEQFSSTLHLVLICGLLLLLVDVLYRKISPLYFLTPPKFFGIATISVTTFVCSLDLSGSYHIDRNGYIILSLVLLFYIAVRKLKWYGPMTSDVYVAAAVILALFPNHSGIVSTVLMFFLGLGFIVWGSRVLRIAHLNMGVIWLMLLIAVRFFDSSQSLLIRGIAFILLGIAFLLVNFFVSRKKRGQVK